MAKRVLNLIIAALILLLTLSSCSGNASVEISDMSAEELEECVSLCQYKNLEISTNLQSY